MTILEEIKNAILDILKKCPSYQDKVYLLDDFCVGMEYINVMYDSFSVESKCVYLDKRGYYINGRATSNEGKMYFSDFSNFKISDEMKLKTAEFKNKEEEKLSVRIPTKDIKIGMVCREFNEYGDYYYIYLGKYIDREGKKYYAYGRIDEYFALDIENYTCNNSWYCENKAIRFDTIYKTVTEKQLKECRENFLYDFGTYNYKSAIKDVGSFEI